MIVIYTADSMLLLTLSLLTLHAALEYICAAVPDAALDHRQYSFLRSGSFHVVVKQKLLL